MRNILLLICFVITVLGSIFGGFLVVSATSSSDHALFGLLLWLVCSFAAPMFAILFFNDRFH